MKMRSLVFDITGEKKSFNEGSITRECEVDLWHRINAVVVGCQ